MTNKETLLLYVIFDEAIDVEYFQIATRFVSYNDTNTSVNELIATISNVKYYIF